jgi:CRISPR type III-B/RAMP module RAMP protein Cmr1
VKKETIKETGIIGSLRWWYDALVRGMGGYACDPTSDEDRCRNKEEKRGGACALGKEIKREGKTIKPCGGMQGLHNLWLHEGRVWFMQDTTQMHYSENEQIGNREGICKIFN